MVTAVQQTGDPVRVAGCAQGIAGERDCRVQHNNKVYVPLWLYYHLLTMVKDDPEAVRHLAAYDGFITKGNYNRGKRGEAAKLNNTAIGWQQHLPSISESPGKIPVGCFAVGYESWRHCQSTIEPGIDQGFKGNFSLLN